MASKYPTLLFLVFSFLAEISAERILFLMPLGTRSHIHVFEPLMRALGERGHEIVALSPITSSGMPATVKQIQIITTEDLLGQMKDPFLMRKDGIGKSMLTNLSVWEPIITNSQKVMESSIFQDILKNEKFDLVITHIIQNLGLLGVIPHFNSSSIYITTLAGPPFITNMVGNRLPPSFIPSLFVDYGDKMSFMQRLKNTLLEFGSVVGFDFFVVPRCEQLYQKYLPNGDKLPGIYEISKDVSMILMNSHFTLTYPRPQLPDVIEVGGMHTRPPKKLPKDLDDFLTGSGKDGFIFFSLGSIAKAKNMPEATRKVFLNVFSRLKHRVIWKWETEEMPDLPKNVKLSKWLPQQDVLGHPNIKLFMSHGGLLSTQESVYHGVPVLGFPIMADQDMNVRQAEATGYAKFVEILDLKEETLEAAILEMLNEPKYTMKAKELSKRFRDQPQTPLDTAVYWTEYVLRHKGASHLRSAARDLNFFQYYVLDVAATLLVVTLIISYLIFRCCKSIFRCICRRKNCGKKAHKKRD